MKTHNEAHCIEIFFLLLDTYSVLRYIHNSQGIYHRISKSYSRLFYYQMSQPISTDLINSSCIFSHSLNILYFYFISFISSEIVSKLTVVHLIPRDNYYYGCVLNLQELFGNLLELNYQNL